MILGIPEDFDFEVESDRTSPSSDQETTSVFRIDSDPFSKLNKKYENDLHYLNNQFEKVISLRDAEIQDMINKEKERIRKELEQQKREREERERIKRQEEEARRKQEEEKQRELERQRKLQEERVRKEKEEEQKRKEIESQKAKEEELKKKEEEKKLREQKELQAREANKSKVVEEEFLAYKQQIKEFKETIVNVVNGDKELKKNVGVVRRKINPKFGQLSNSMRQLNVLTTEIVQLMNTVQQYELVRKFLFNFIAKAIISQAETEIVVQPNAAVPLARLTSNLLQAFPELNTFLMARFVKKCPLVIGYTCSIDTEEGRLRMGWKRNKNTSKWEEPDKYDERVAGICSLFSVLTRLGNPAYPISMSWTLLARIANTPTDLITNVHFFCIANWWEACGKFFIEAYKSQAVKLLQLLAYELTNNKKLPAATRLKILAEEGIHSGIKCLKEMTT